MQTSHSRSQQGHHASWHNQSPEKRPLRRHKPTVGPGGQSQESPNSRVYNSGHPDVYPQDPKQEEDKMTETRLQQGYKIPVPQIEYESLITTKNPRLSAQEDGFPKAAKWIVQIMHKKNDLNIVSLDKRKIKEGTFQSFAHAVNSGNLKGGKEHQKFFEDLARGSKSLQSLNKRFPLFKRKDECMEYIYSCKVPIQKAIWFFKMSQVAHGSTLVTQNKQKKTSLEQYSADQTKLFAKYFRDMLKRFQDSPQVESSPAYHRWPYFICLFKHSFEEGIVDRHDFLMDISDLPNDYINFPLEKPQIFRMLILFLSQFVDVITQNVFLARKVAYIITSRLRIYKKDFERKKGSISNASECFNDLIHCQHHS
uniref:Mediator complex subunit Med12 domain-containing protein n=1 Tax=Ditylenchus dipsaci TaxID=166011 RepID=A0A915DEG6_9BILA